MTEPQNGEAICAYGLNAPRNDKEVWEIMIGAILTQNTAWKNVEKALGNLIKDNSLDVVKIANIPLPTLQRLIKPSGFYKQKAKRLKSFAQFVLSFGSVNDFTENITRNKLLEFNGIGQETADSIILYACNKPYFVIDSYTRRIFSRLGLEPDLTSNHKKDYELWRLFFEKNIPKNIELYKEYHALIVQHAKNNCNKNPICDECTIKRLCKI